MPSAVTTKTAAAKSVAGSKTNAPASGAGESTGSKTKPNTLKKKRKGGLGIEGGGPGGADEEEAEGEEDEVADEETVEPDNEPFDLGNDKWAVRFYTSTTPSKGKALIDDEGRGPRTREIFEAKAHSCRFLCRGYDWSLKLFAFEDGPPYFDDESEAAGAAPLIVTGSNNRASKEGWKAYEVVRATAAVRGPAKEKVELDEEEKEDLLELVKEFRKLGKKGARAQMDLGDEECLAELRKAVKAGLLNAAELKEQVDKFKQASKADAQPVASTSGTRHDNEDTASVKSKKSSKGDDGASIKSKRSSK